MSTLHGLSQEEIEGLAIQTLNRKQRQKEYVMRKKQENHRFNQDADKAWKQRNPDKVKEYQRKSDQKRRQRILMLSEAEQKQRRERYAGYQRVYREKLIRQRVQQESMPEVSSPKD